MKSSDMDQCSRSTNGRAFARLRRGASAAFIGAVFLSASAVAGTPGLDATVTSLVPFAPGSTTVRPISYSATSTYQSAYAVQITNSTSSNINNIFFSIVSSVTNGLNAPFTTPVDGLRLGDTCTASLGGTRLDCQFVSLPAGSAPISFTLLVPSPVAPPAVGGTVPDSILSVAWAIQAGQGNSNSSNFVHQGSQDVTLQVGSAADGVESYVLQNAVLGVADSGTQTNVKPPKPVTVGVKQIVSPSSCSPHYKQCFESTIRIVDGSGQPVIFVINPGDSPLVIDLFRAASSLKKNAKFSNAQLFYTGDDNVTYTIPTCVGGQVPTIAPFRCITPAVPAGTAVAGQDTGVDSFGDWLFHILGKTNGIINW